ncbi:MAG: ATP-binding protein [Chloroflexi bacterium]|nr:ATP-binding protein [Chloroflexota bacterium]
MADRPERRFLAAEMSDGTLRALAILVALRQPPLANRLSVPLVGIEEPELAIHPSAIPVLRDALIEASGSTQILVSTHSPELLDDWDVAVESVLAVLMAGGRTQIGPLEPAIHAIVADRLYTLGELLRSTQLPPHAADPAHGPATATVPQVGQA